MWRALVLVLSLGLLSCADRAPEGFSNTDISGAEIGNSLAAFKDQRGNAISLDDFKGKVVVVLFGYTRCPDVCPTTLARLAEAMKQLGSDANQVQVLMVTVDPQHDTPEVLSTYMTSFNPAFLGLIGDLPATEAAAKAFKVFFARHDGQAGVASHPPDHAHAPADHAVAAVVDHSAAAYIFDGSGEIRLYVKDDAPVAGVVSDLRHLLKPA